MWRQEGLRVIKSTKATLNAVKDFYNLQRTSVNIAVLKRVLCDGTSAAVSTVYSPSYR